MFPKTVCYSFVVNDAANIHLNDSFASHITPRNFVIMLNYYPLLKSKNGMNND